MKFREKKYQKGNERVSARTVVAVVTITYAEVASLYEPHNMVVFIEPSLIGLN